MISEVGKGIAAQSFERVPLDRIWNESRGSEATFPDLPKAITSGKDLEDALDACKKRWPKLALYVAMRERDVSNSELARRLGCSETVVRRMLNPRHDTRPEPLQAALRRLGTGYWSLDDAA